MIKTMPPPATAGGLSISIPSTRGKDLSLESFAFILFLGRKQIEARNREEYAAVSLTEAIKQAQKIGG